MRTRIGQDEGRDTRSKTEIDEDDNPFAELAAMQAAEVSSTAAGSTDDRGWEWRSTGSRWLGYVGDHVDRKWNSGGMDSGERRRNSNVGWKDWRDGGGDNSSGLDPARGSYDWQNQNANNTGSGPAKGSNNPVNRGALGPPKPLGPAYYVARESPKHVKLANVRAQQVAEESKNGDTNQRRLNRLHGLLVSGRCKSTQRGV
jgi:hypothetical protein